jgi:hypothetical protein
MKRNLGNIDKALRVLGAIIIAVLYLTHVVTGAVATVLLIVGAILLLTGFIGTCPLYSLMGASTCAKKQ